MIAMTMSRRPKNGGKRSPKKGRESKGPCVEVRDATGPDQPAQHEPAPLPSNGEDGSKPSSPPDVKRAPEKIIKRLVDIGWEQKQLSVATGLGESRISRWLSGVGNPKPLQFLSMARALGVTVDYLIDDGQDASRPALDPDEARLLVIARELGYQVARRRLLQLDDTDGRQPAPGTTTGRPPTPPDARGSRDTG
jgi:transcriptional regulator with XRE-family HTH domain